MLISLEAPEASGLEAEDVKYVTLHICLNEKSKTSACYCFPGWRTWAALATKQPKKLQVRSFFN